MRHYEDRIIPQRTEKHTVKVTCDICGNETGKTGQYEKNEVTVEHQEGTTYPEGSNIDITSFDICPECWETKLIPYLESLGAKKLTRNINW